MRDRRDEVAAAVAAAGWEVGDCHDLLHRPFTPACWGLPGGPARHLSLWCHRYLPYWSGVAGPHEAPEGLLCLDCGRL